MLATVSRRRGSANNPVPTRRIPPRTTERPQQKREINRAPSAEDYSSKTETISFGRVLDAWLATSAAKHKRSTHATYLTIAEKHLRPALERYPVEDISAEVLAGFMREKVYGGAEAEALSSSSVCGIVTVLRAAFRYAETMGCAVKAWGALERPKLTTRETETLTNAEQERLQSFLLRERNFEKLGVLVCLYTGLRIGELCSLKWGDISLDTATLTVSRTVQRIKNEEYKKGVGKGSERSKTTIVFDAPKSRRSNRSIPLPSFLTGILREDARDGRCFLLSGDPVHFIEPRTFQNHFKAMLAEAGVRDINFHALRHTFATNCVELGFDVKTLSEILGHADVSVTLNTYVHPSLTKMRSYMELLGGGVSA